MFRFPVYAKKRYVITYGESAVLDCGFIASIEEAKEVCNKFIRAYEAKGMKAELTVYEVQDNKAKVLLKYHRSEGGCAYVCEAL